MSDREYPPTGGTEGPEIRKPKKKSCWDDDGDAWWEDRTIPEKVLIVIGFVILGIGLVFLFGWIVMLLWNWLMPDIFGVGRVSYWQAWGLLLLSCILFKDFGSGDSGRSDRKRKRHLRQYIREEVEKETGFAADEGQTGETTIPPAEPAD